MQPVDTDRTYIFVSVDTAWEEAKQAATEAAEEDGRQWGYGVSVAGALAGIES